MTSTINTILTVGHSNHASDSLIALLHMHQVTAVADVRSAPYSRFNPQFNRDSLNGCLEKRGIKYTFLGRELGGRFDDPTCYVDGRVRYDRVAATESFRHGLDKVVQGATDHRIVLLCAEREPLDCHRTLLVARALEEQGIDVAHIHADGRLETHAEAMDRLLKRFNLHPDGDLFRSLLPREKLVAEAVAQQEKRIAFVKENPASARKRSIQ